jgi:hypothetical protein
LVDFRRNPRRDLKWVAICMPAANDTPHYQSAADLFSLEYGEGREGIDDRHSRAVY